MATIVSTLYPPLIDTFMPAFLYEGPALVNFSLSPYNNIGEIKKIHVSLVNQKTNRSVFQNSLKNATYTIWNNIWIVPFDVNGNSFLKVDTSNNTCTLKIPKEILKDSGKGFLTDFYYKVQIRLDSSSEEASTSVYLTTQRGRFSEWSSVCLLKAIPRVEIGMTDFDTEYADVVNQNVISKVRTVQPGIVPLSGSVVFTNNNVVSTKNEETLQKYRITITSNSNNEVIDKTKDWVQTNNNSDPNRIYWLADLSNAGADEEYTVLIEVVTKNQYTFSKKYQIKIANFDALEFTPVWNYKSAVLNEFGDAVDKIITEEDGMVTFAITSEEELPQGFLYVKRATSLDNFKTWELISCTANSGKLNKTITDPTIGSLIKYQYSCQYRIKRSGMWTETKFSNRFVYPDYYDMLIYRNGRQLAIRYNAQISSYSSVVNRQVINTLGSKYPKFAENAQMNYRKFTITGLITSEADFNRTFLNDRDYPQEMNDYDQYMNGRYEVRNDTISDDTYTYSNVGNYSATKNATQYLMKSSLHDLAPKDNWWLERKFREEVLSWLNNGEPKLFRSMAEGNLVVMLTDISLTPNTQVGRRTYNISMTAYEVEDGYSLDVLSSLGIINIPDEYSDYINAGMASDTSDEEEEESSDGSLEETVVGQLNNRRGFGNYFVDDGTELLSAPSVSTYTINDIYNGLIYTGSLGNYKVIDGSFQLKDLKIQFLSEPQWYDISKPDENSIKENLVQSENLFYGYKIELKIYTSSGSKTNIIFVNEKGYYQIPSNIIVSDIKLFDEAIATLDYKLTYKRTYDESSIPTSAEIAQKIVGQISGKWENGNSIADKIKNKYEYYWTTENKKVYNGVLEKQYLDKITAFGFDGTSYAMFNIKFENDDVARDYVVGRTGVYNLMTDYPIEEVIFLGRRMFRKDNEDYSTHKTNNFILDASTAGYQPVPTSSFYWYNLDDGSVVTDALIIINGNYSSPESNQIVKNFIDVETHSPYNSIAEIINPVQNTIYGILNENQDVILMLYTKENKWVNVWMENEDSHAILGIEAEQEEIFSGKKKFFLEDWEFSIDKSAFSDNDDLVWYKTYLGKTNTLVRINQTTNINHYITDLEENINVPEIDGYLSINDIKNPEYNTIYGFKDGNSKVYKIYYIDQGWYDVNFIDQPDNTVIIARVPVYGMVNYRGNLVKIKYT